jgi:hypothetical protein
MKTWYTPAVAALHFLEVDTERLLVWGCLLSLLIILSYLVLACLACILVFIDEDALLDDESWRKGLIAFIAVCLIIRFDFFIPGDFITFLAAHGGLSELALVTAGFLITLAYARHHNRRRFTFDCVWVIAFVFALSQLVHLLPLVLKLGTEEVTNPGPVILAPQSTELNEGIDEVTNVGASTAFRLLGAPVLGGLVMLCVYGHRLGELGREKLRKHYLKRYLKHYFTRRPLTAPVNPSTAPVKPVSLFMDSGSEDNAPESERE